MTFLDDGFFHALQQDPNDDLLRLVYADFVEERGDNASTAYAELIRIQIEMAAILPSNRWAMQRIANLTVRQEEILAEWERVWLGDWAEILDKWVFRRGLVEAIQVDASVFLDYAPDWFAQWPSLTVAKLTRAAGHLAELARCPWIAHLRGLDLSDNSIDAKCLSDLTSSRFICLLQALDLSSNPIGPEGVEHLAKTGYAQELTELHLDSCGLGRDGLRQLASARLRKWSRLDLSANDISRRDLIGFVESPSIQNLVALDFSYNPLGENGATILADSPNLANLMDLGLCSTGTGDEDLYAICHSPYFSNLRSLDIRNHRCDMRLDREGENWGGIGELSRSPFLSQLRRFLLIGSSRFGNEWIPNVLKVIRPPHRETVSSDGWTAKILRKSRYLMPSQLVDCDLEEIWWLGDPNNRERLPKIEWDYWDYFA
jgi:uncharacterized protein (TIGR02996 family)